MKRLLLICLFIIFSSLITLSFAESLYDKVYAEYPREKYLVGIGEVGKTDNLFKDKRVAEVLARAEIAKQIKVRLNEETIDIMCEGGKSRLFKDKLQCRNEFIMIVEVTVDEFLEGSRIVNYGEKEGVIYAVAVMPRAEFVKELEKNTKEAIDKVKSEIERAKEGDKDSIKKVKEEYMKVLTYNKEREIIEGVKSRASEVFEDLEKEIEKLREEE